MSEIEDKLQKDSMTIKEQIMNLKNTISEFKNDMLGSSAKKHDDFVSKLNVNISNDKEEIDENKNNNRGNNSCYYTLVEEYKFPVWIYGHDHKENDITINNTRFVSNPWGYDTKDFKIKSLTFKK